jgi:hypothetical protein
MRVKAMTLTSNRGFNPVVMGRRSNSIQRSGADHGILGIRPDDAPVAGRRDCCARRGATDSPLDNAPIRR